MPKCCNVGARAARGGFALVMSLALIAVAAIALAGIARRSTLAAVESATASEALKRRWAVRSLRATLLPRAGEILPRGEAGARRTGDGERASWPLPARRRLALELAGIEYELVVVDEQAKVNVNALLDAHGRAEARGRLEALLAAGRNARAARLALRTSRRPDTNAWARIGSYDQLFAGAAPGRLRGGPRVSGLAAAVTCWGSGRVNLRRAPDRVVRATLLGRVEPRVVDAVLEARARGRPDGAGALLAGLESIGAEARQRVAAHATVGSETHGLWVVARTDRRSWHTLAIRAPSGRFAFSW